MFRRPAARISLSMVLMTISILLVGDMIGLVPKRGDLLLEYRGKLGESLATQLSYAVQKRDRGAIRGILKTIVEKNEDVLSAALRRASGKVLVATGDHKQHWGDFSGEKSTLTHILAPVSSGGARFGTVEVRFAPVASGISRLPGNTLVGMIALVGVVGFCGNLFFLKRALRHLDPTSLIPTRVKETLDLLTEGVVLLDAKKCIVIANSAFARQLRCPVDDLLGTRIEELGWHVPSGKTGKSVHSYQFPWVQALQVGKIQVGASMYLQDERSGMRTFTVNSCPICDANYNIQGVLVTFDDVTQLEKMVDLLETSRDEIAEKNKQLERTNHVIEAKVKERTKELLAAKEVAEAADRAKSAFLANISHELRTPMHAILSFSEFGVKRIEKASKEKLRDYFEKIKTSGTSLLAIVDDLLDLSKFRVGRMPCELEKSDLREVVESLLKEFSGIIKKEAVEVKFLSGDIDATAMFDVCRISQLVRNLLSNAVKFGGSKTTITITLKEVNLDSAAASPPALEVSVIDEGPGIPEAEIEKIFEPFIQSKRTATGAGGTGLGLSICREIVGAHGGWIRAANRPEGGAILTFVIPRVPSEVLKPAEFVTS